MGTRSTVKFYESIPVEGTKPVLSIYNQFDGYLSGVGHQLANWLVDKKILNGYQRQTMQEGYANGFGCLAAQYVAAHKQSIGGCYCTTEDDSQEYNYRVYPNEAGQIIIEVNDIFIGTPQELLDFQEPEVEE